MKTKVAVWAAGLGLLTGACLPLLAHHSFAAEYDTAKPVVMKGKFVKMDWVNPHSWVYFDVTDENGKTSTWKAETPPPNGLYRNGWRQNMLKPGDELTVRGNLAKDATNLMWASQVTFADGKVITLNSSPTPQEKQEK
jgi:hypothetical protein